MPPSFVPLRPKTITDEYCNLCYQVCFRGKIPHSKANSNWVLDSRSLERSRRHPYIEGKPNYDLTQGDQFMVFHHLPKHQLRQYSQSPLIHPSAIEKLGHKHEQEQLTHQNTEHKQHSLRQNHSYLLKILSFSPHLRN